MPVATWLCSRVRVLVLQDWSPLGYRLLLLNRSACTAAPVAATTPPLSLAMAGRLSLPAAASPCMAVSAGQTIAPESLTVGEVSPSAHPTALFTAAVVA